MKYIAGKGKPDIPLKLIETQQTGNLVFFCGAGISCDAGLPNFDYLVKKVYEKLGEQETENEMEAINNKFYDRALGLLEARIIGQCNPEINFVRKTIIEELTFKNNPNLDCHQTILNLSKTKNQKYRLVTTNVDHGFLKVIQDTSHLFIDVAPKLPVPKPYKWESIVHLHGLIDDRDSNGEQLIFTSGDFGTAYLTERWASRFVTELFRHFTVVFVGYRVNDPVIRYITDAIASERLRGYEDFKTPYVFTCNDQKEWEAKFIEPILYSCPNKNHENLYNTLKEWYHHIRDGLNSIKRIINQAVTIRPVPPYDEKNSEQIQRVIDVLKEKTEINHKSITGYPAKIFSKLDNPPFSIEWLDVLHKNNLMSIAQKNKKLYPISPSSYSNIVQPNIISLNLWNWLLHHLENNDLIEWVIDNGICLHPTLNEKIAKRIENSPLREPYLRFWRIVASNYVTCGRQNTIGEYRLITTLERGIDDLAIAELSKLLEPSFKISKSIYSSYKNADDNTERASYHIEVTIGFSEWIFQKLIKMDCYPNELTDLLLPATQALNKALDFWNFDRPDEKIYDPSHWDMVSISSHLQNKHYRTWVILIELCRDLWEATWELDRVKA